MTARVSVVIPTRGRPGLVSRAVRSVVSQTEQSLEIIVVVDGPDAATMAVLANITDPRFMVVANARSLGAAGARNVGVMHATGQWVAFLDDDDEWMPQKLARQLAFAETRGTALYTCLNRVVTPLAAYVWPETLFDNLTPLDVYLFDKRNAMSGSAFIQTSGFMLPRALFLKSPFPVDSPHDDWEFALRLNKQLGVRIEMVPEVLVTLHVDEDRPTLSSSARWRASLQWLDRIRPLLTRRGYSGICLGVVGPRAASEGAWSAFFLLLSNAFRHGRPRPMHVIAYLAFWLIPAGLRRRMRAALRARPAPQPGLSSI